MMWPVTIFGAIMLGLISLPYSWRRVFQFLILAIGWWLIAYLSADALKAGFASQPWQVLEYAWPADPGAALVARLPGDILGLGLAVLVRVGFLWLMGKPRAESGDQGG